MQHTIGTLFSGIGGPEIAARALGLKGLFYCDINKFGLAVLRKHFPEAEEFHDVTKEDFSKYMGMVTMLVGGFPCFVAGTPVLTSEGYIPIEGVKEGMKVCTHAGRFEKVLGTMSHEDYAVMEIGVEGLHDPIRCTPNHPFLVYGRFDESPKWVAANELSTGMRLFAPGGTWRASVENAHPFDGALRPTKGKDKFTIISIIRKFKTQKVYNLNVERDHTYTVHGIAVHNCQPFSHAGMRKGADDSRYLWPAFLDVIRSVRPTVVIGENVAGIATMVEPGEDVQVEHQASLFDEGDEVREYERRQRYTAARVCEDLDSAGYAVQPVLIPACAVGAPHKRDRVFFIAFRKDGVICGIPDEDKGHDAGTDGGAVHGAPQQVPADSGGERLQGEDKRGVHEQERLGQVEQPEELPYGAGDAWCVRRWDAFPIESPVCCRDDGFSDGLVRYLTPEVYERALESMTPEVRESLNSMMESGSQEYKDFVSEYKIKFHDIPLALRFGVYRDKELSVWADGVSGKVLAYMDGLGRIDSNGKFFSLCRKVQTEIRSIRAYVYQESLKAYGNAIVPAVIYEIMVACMNSIKGGMQCG